MNGAFFNYDLPFPLDQWDCLDGEAGDSWRAFLEGWITTVAGSSSSTAAQASKDWFESTGNDLLGDLEDAFKCIDATPSQAKLNKAIGSDIYADGWFDTVNSWAEDNQGTLFSKMQSAKGYLDQANMLFVGEAIGSLYGSVAGADEIYTQLVDHSDLDINFGVIRNNH